MAAKLGRGRVGVGCGEGNSIACARLPCSYCQATSVDRANAEAERAAESIPHRGCGLAANRRDTSAGSCAAILPDAIDVKCLTELCQRRNIL